MSEARRGDTSRLSAGVLSVQQELVQRSADTPGVTFVVGPHGAGKTTLAHMLANDPRGGRVVEAHPRRARDLDEVERQVHAELGEARQGDLILDDFDELHSASSLERLMRFARASWLHQAHVLIFSRAAPDGVRKAFREAERTRARPYRVVDLMWSYTDLAADLWDAADRGRQDGRAVEAVIELLHSIADNPDVAQAVMAAARHQLAGDRSKTPDLLLVPDRNGLIRVLPSTDLGLTDLELAPGRSLVATPRITYRATRGFWLPEAARLEKMINDPDVTERDLQEFFEQHRQLLAGTSYERVVAHPILARDQEGPLIPDFMLEPVNQGFADVLDLKLPRARLVAGRVNRLRPSAQVAEALAQVREYRAYFEDPRRRQAVQDRYGLQAYRPTVAVLMGRDPGPGLDKFELKRLWDELPDHVRLLTYDELLRRVRRFGLF